MKFTIKTNNSNVTFNGDATLPTSMQMMQAYKEAKRVATNLRQDVTLVNFDGTEIKVFFTAMV